RRGGGKDAAARLAASSTAAFAGNARRRARRCARRRNGTGRDFRPRRRRARTGRRRRARSRSRRRTRRGGRGGARRTRARRDRDRGRRHDRRPAAAASAARSAVALVARRPSGRGRSVKVVVLSGGVGGARFVKGVVEVAGPRDVTVVGNVGDDLEVLGMHVSPDLDSILYALAGLNDEQRGWGREGET